MHSVSQAYSQQATGHSNGILNPGQTIQIGKYLVQVERYLSQGGYAHVYVVVTTEPINGTNRHVLKRIAVPDAAGLREVQKEVEIMRILKGHPNIVHFIDASWSQLQNGSYEVFILMEFCAGGGIIDMMNRRLRERLTEDEILQIFVDVCEAVAAMHNLKPALLHRDLKVENILQASSSCFKLCDFGSAATTGKTPSSAAEIRVLEADLNRHTTMQYRAPEMVDVYLRRRIDEKSDMWALGVLLYKLCYYTTPFEEHGPLAILNVQYKIPSFPVYSQRLNRVIHSLLQEHGSQRPTIFTLLDEVHAMRGTKSKFHYTRVDPVPTLDTKLVRPELALPTPSKPFQEATRSTSPSAKSNLATSQALKPKPQTPIRTPYSMKNNAKASSPDDVWTPRPIPTNTYQPKQQLGAKNAAHGFADSFGESFGATKPKAISLNSFEDSFVPILPKNVISRTTPVKSSGGTFRDAFTGLDRLAVPSASTGSSTSSRNNSRSRSPADANLLTAPSEPTLPSTAKRSLALSLPEPDVLSVEQRFPALEDFTDETSSLVGHLTSAHLSTSPLTGNKALDTKVVIPSRALQVPHIAPDGSRSQHVTGTAMLTSPTKERVASSSLLDDTEPSVDARVLKPTRPTLQRKHRSSTNIRSPTSYRHESAKWPPADVTADRQSQTQEREWVTADTNGNEHDSTRTVNLAGENRSHVLSQSSKGDTGQQRDVSDVATRRSPIKSYEKSDPDGKARSSDEDAPEEPISTFSSRALRVTKSRQSSVHNLVDFYDGDDDQDSRAGLKSERPTTASIPKSVASSTHGNRSTTLLSSTTPPQRKQPTRGDLTTVERPLNRRPQSLLITTPSSSYKMDTKMASPPSSARPNPRSRASSRRNSISEIVEKYESRGSKDTGPISPPFTNNTVGVEAVTGRSSQATAALKSSTPSYRSSVGDVADKANRQSTRLVVASPTEARSSSSARSPIKPPTVEGIKGIRQALLNVETAPVVDSAHAVPIVPIPSPDSRAPPVPSKSTKTSSALATPRSLASLLTADANTQPKSSTPQPETSPDRPFQGVGKLIQQWQQLSEERR